MKRFANPLMMCLLCGCVDNQLGIEHRRPNRPPQTVISGGPIDRAPATIYRVELFWRGSDQDGSIDHFDFIMVDHPGVVDSIHGSFAVEVPSVDDPRWLGTKATDSLFVALADTLRRDPAPGEGESPPDVLRHPFERWHTFFVRAVDNEGLPDPTPDYVSFNAVNLAPTIRLRRPVSPGFVFDAPPAVFFAWDGEDPIGDGTLLDPVASRWVLITSQVGSDGSFASWPDSLYHLPRRFSWSPWHAWDTADSSGVKTLVQGLFPAGVNPSRGFYILGVQALDEAGAITPVFDVKTPGKNNAVLIRVAGPRGPTLLVEDRFLGIYTFVGESSPVRLEAAAGQPIHFEWSADASKYGSEIAGYRFAWNVLDPQDDEEWSSWALTSRASPTRSFASGTQRFYLQARDNAGNVTSVVFVIATHPVTLSRDVLWVDDTAPITPASAQEVQEDERWLQVFSQLGVKHGFSFVAETDVYDATAREFRPPPIELVFRYKVIVWSVRNGAQGLSGLRTLSQFFDPFAGRNANRSGLFNYLDTYLKHGGKLWINGFRPAVQIWPSERDRDTDPNVVNVTNWDDPLDPHPFIDSVGTRSLLYRMGIEMFDVGAATGAARSSIPHYCTSVEPETPPGSQVQRFESTNDLDHSHDIELEHSEVDRPSGMLQRDSDVALEHRHTVHFSLDDLLTLRRGQEIQVATDSSDLPAPHSHKFMIRDQVGLWGVPPLFTGAGWRSIAGSAGRANVEIYNMPSAMGTQAPPLVPPLGKSLVLYRYVSGVSENSTTQYPLTADRQPVVVLSKRSPSDPTFAFAMCGFEPEALLSFSHEMLAEFIIVRHFGLVASGTGMP